MLGRVVRLRGGALLGAFVILTVAATIAAAAGQIVASALGAPGAGRFAAADAVVRADPSFRIGGANGDTITVQRSPRLPEAALGRVRSVPGVRTAVGDLAFPVTVAARGSAPIPARGGVPVHGHGWPSASLTPYRLVDGSAPTQPDQVVVDAWLARAGRLRVGAVLRVAAPAGSAAFRVSGIAAASSAQAGQRSAVFFTQARADQLSGLPSGFDAIAVRADAGANQPALRARIATAVGDHAEVLDRRHASAADAGDVGAVDRIALVAVLASGGGITLGIAIFVAAGTIGFAVEGRRRQVAVVRVIGATPGQVRRSLMLGTGVLGLVAGVSGSALATVLMGLFVRALVAVDLAPHGFAVTPDWIPYGIAIGADAMVAVAATAVAAHRALAVAPGEAVVESAIPPRRLGIVRTLLGLAAVGGGLTLVVTLSHEALAFSTLAATSFAIAVALLGPLVIGWPVAVFGRLVSGTGGAGYLAATGAAGGRFRIGAAGAAVALVVALTGTQVVSLATAKRAAQRTSSTRVVAQRVIVSQGGGLPPGLASAAGRLPGVTATGVVSTEVYLLDHHLTNQDSSWPAAGLDPRSRATLHLDVRAGSLAAVHGTDVAVSRTLADTGHIGVGSRLAARLADGTPATLRVVAVYARSNGLGDVVLAPRLALAHATAAVDQAVFVSGARRPSVIRALGRITHGVPGAVLLNRAQYLRGVNVQEQQDADQQWVVDALMILVATLAAFNTGAISAAERRPELALARLCGATRNQLTRSLALESLLTTLAGIAVGAIVVLISVSQAGHDPTGGPLALPIGHTALVVAGAAALGLGGTLIPSLLAGNDRPAAALSAAE